ncbi:Crp/Fnr family transcriptional regulator [Gemmatirosa kalamazoonensis]|uniref:Crp/Fnr family transcriptional regulator n=1 Tax=Gemmatirosa kalamazoonensis TaxID=861299 RepID=UPI00130E8AAB|nr:Crp/Fnr family transcriptional regulator [Gemmatirosa kalamazoonensis]
MRTATRGERVEHNRLLRALPATEYDAMRADLHDVAITQGAVLCEAQALVTHVYFPQRCVVSLLTPVDEGPAVEVGLVGNEGMVGLTVFLGGRLATTQAVLQVPDGASRMTAAAFRRALRRGPALPALMQAYARTMLGQITQNAACSQRHLVGPRCARWLLMAHDRVGEDRFTLTQAFLGQMLGVQRATVSMAAQALHTLGVIRYARGHVTVTDRAGLEAAACACYDVIAADYARAFPRAAE